MRLRKPRLVIVYRDTVHLSYRSVGHALYNNSLQMCNNLVYTHPSTLTHNYICMLVHTHTSTCTHTHTHTHTSTCTHTHTHIPPPSHLSPSHSPQISSRLDSLHQHVAEVQKQKQTVHEHLFANNESIGRIQGEVNASVTSNSGEIVNK